MSGTEDFSRWIRMITNVYTVIFEKGKNSTVRSLTKTAAPRDLLTLTESAVYASLNVPRTRFYQALTIGGSFVAGNEITNSITIDHPAGWANSTQMWFAARIAPTWASGTVAPPTTEPTLWVWGEDASNLLRVSYDKANGRWRVRRLAAGAGSDVVNATAHAANDHLTIIGQWTATQVKISHNGGVFTSAANTSLPTITVDQKIGYDTSQACRSVVYWMMMGTGTLTDADAAAIHALGDTDPTWDTIPSFYTSDPAFIWPALDSSHVVTANWGEGFYA